MHRQTLRYKNTSKHPKSTTAELQSLHFAFCGCIAYWKQWEKTQHPAPAISHKRIASLRDVFDLSCFFSSFFYVFLLYLSDISRSSLYLSLLSVSCLYFFMFYSCVSADQELPSCRAPKLHISSLVVADLANTWWIWPWGHFVPQLMGGRAKAQRKRGSLLRSHWLQFWIFRSCNVFQQFVRRSAILS